MSVVIVIPARHASTRYPGKPLVELRGATGQALTLIRRSWEAARQVRDVDRVIVATDDERIADHAAGFGAETAMTSTQARDQILDEPGGGQRRVALQVHDDLGPRGELTQHLGTALGAVAAVGAGHGDLGAEARRMVGDAGVVGGNDHALDPGDLAGGVPAAADQAAGLATRAAQLDQRLAGVAG